MELLNYWKEILITVSLVFGALATISEKFRDAVTFWKTRKSEAKKDELNAFQALEEYQQRKIKELIDDLESETERFNNKIKEANNLVSRAEEENEKSKITLNKYKTILTTHRNHIKYLEGVLIKNKIEFNKIKTDD